MIRVGLLGIAHVHSPSYVHALQDISDATLIGHWDRDETRSAEFSTKFGLKGFSSAQELVDSVDATIICSENLFHGQLLELSIAANKPVLCEKPLAASRSELTRIEKLISGATVPVMTAFPCPFSPAFQKLAQRVANGEIGDVLAINATNRGKCPFGWFVEPELSGGGCMIDHTVHVADLIYRLLGESPKLVSAQVGSNMYGETWEDTAHLTLDHASGIFATIDSSWSRTKNYHTWGDVNLTITGSAGVIECSLFNQGIFLTKDSCQLIGTGSNLDEHMIREFLSRTSNSNPGQNRSDYGLRASAIALAAYDSASSGQPTSLN